MNPFQPLPSKMEVPVEQLAAFVADSGPDIRLSSLKLGFAIGLSEIGLLPSEFESLVKQAEGGPLDFIMAIPKALGSATLYTGAAGALGGAYTGYLRHKTERAVDGKDDPETLALQNKLNAYRQMTQDLRRTDKVQAVA